MTEAIKERSTDEVREALRRVHAMSTGDEETAGDVTMLGKLAALSGGSEFPAWVKCASLSWQALRQALDDDASGSGRRARGTE